MIQRKEYIQLLLITFGLLALFLFLAFLLKSAVEVLLLTFAGILFAVFVRGSSGFLFIRFIGMPVPLAIAITLLLLVLALTVFIILLAPDLTTQGAKLVDSYRPRWKNSDKKQVPSNGSKTCSKTTARLHLRRPVK